MMDDFINNYYVTNILFCVIISVISVAVVKSMKQKYEIQLKDKLLFKKINISLLLSYVLITMGSTFLIFQTFEFISKFININFTSVTEPTNIAMIVTSFITTCIFAPITEEIIFRFGLLEYLKNKSNKIFSIILSSIIFSLLHLYNIDGLILTLLVGIMCGISYVKTDNLLFPIIIHLVYNLYALFGNYLLLSNSYELCIGLILLTVGIVINLLSNKNTCNKQVYRII